MEILKLVLPCERKSSALEKIEIFTNFFWKNWAPRIWGVGRFAAFYKNYVIFENFLYYSEKNIFLGLFYFKEIRQKVP